MSCGPFSRRSDSGTRWAFEFTPGRKTSVELEDALAIDNNLVVRAARLFFDEKKVHGGLKMRLTKRIPMGGGLGGGSSDAACTLLALPALTGRKATLGELTAMGAQLGSDVPFFLLGGCALGLGRGEELYPLPEPKPLPVLVLAPRIHVSTPEAYKALGRPALTETDGIATLKDVPIVRVAGVLCVGRRKRFRGRRFPAPPGAGWMAEKTRAARCPFCTALRQWGSTLRGVSGPGQASGSPSAVSNGTSPGFLDEYGHANPLSSGVFAWLAGARDYRNVAAPESIRVRP